MTFVLKKPRRENAIMQTNNNKNEEIPMKKAWRVTYTPDKERMEEDTVFAETYEMAYVEFAISHGKNCEIIEIKEIEDRKI